MRYWKWLKKKNKQKYSKTYANKQAEVLFCQIKERNEFVHKGY